MIAGGTGLARSRMRKHLRAEHDFLRGRASTTELLPDHVVVSGEPGDSKRAAVGSGDRELSRDRMRRHLDALVAR
ncbi:MAG TPA: hypothetical protein VFW16_07580 [Streptosporangiaceae bacterium]|nr:hypothetical protein [Streptosporangiaceae bacterium]